MILFALLSADWTPRPNGCRGGDYPVDTCDFIRFRGCGCGFRRVVRNAFRTVFRRAAVLVGFDRPKRGFSAVGTLYRTTAFRGAGPGSSVLEADLLAVRTVGCLMPRGVVPVFFGRDRAGPQPVGQGLRNFFSCGMRFFIKVTLLWRKSGTKMGFSPFPDKKVFPAAGWRLGCTGGGRERGKSADAWFYRRITLSLLN